ncbi:unnamed protein product [Closterium sp. NIES-54]
MGVRVGQTCGKFHTEHRCLSRLDDTRRAEFGDDVERPRWTDLLRSGVAIFDLDYDAIISAMYALSFSAEGDCYRCVPPDPGIAAALLGASASGTPPGIALAEALHTFTLDSGASSCFFRDSTTLTPLPAPVPVRLADPSGGLVLARSSNVLPCPAVPSGSLSGLHLPSFSTNLVSTAALQDAMVTTTTPGGHRVRVRLGSHVLLVSPPVAPDSSVAPPPGSPLPATPLWHALPVSRLWSTQVSASPPALACPALPSLRQGAVARRSSLLLVSPDDCSPADSLHGLRLQLRERSGQDLPVLRLHSHRGGEFSSDLLRDFCRGEGILQSMVMDVARTSMIHAAAPHFLWLLAVRYAVLAWSNLWPRVSLPETSPTLCWTGKVGDASVFRDVTFNESVPFYRLFPRRSSLLPVAVGSGTAPGAASGGAEPGGAGSEGAGYGGAEPRGAEPEGVEPGGAESEGAESGGAAPWGVASSGAPAGASSRLSLQQLRQCLVQHAHCQSGAHGAGDTGSGGAGVSAEDAGSGGTAATDPGGARTSGAGAARTGGVGGAGARDPTEPGAAGAGGAGAIGAGAAGAGAFDPGAGGAGGTVWPRPYFVPLLQQVLGVPSSTGLPPPFLCPPPDLSQPPLQPASPLPTPSPYTEQSGGLTERREPESRPVLHVRTAHRAPRSRPPLVPGTHAMALCPSSVPLRVPLPAPPESSLPEVPAPESDHARTASPTVSRLLATAVTDPSFESAVASALVAELLDFVAAPPSFGGECALGTDVLEDRQEDFECLAAAVPRFASMLLAPEGDPDAPDIPTPRSYAEAITGPYSSQQKVAMDAEMASWKSTGTYVDEVPPPGVNIVDGMWVFRVKRPPGSPPAFKARYVARGFSQRQGVDYFQTFSPTPKMTTLRVLLHVAAQRDYELHSLDFSTPFLQGSLHEEIWLR